MTELKLRNLQRTEALSKYKQHRPDLQRTASNMCQTSIPTMQLAQTFTEASLVNVLVFVVICSFSAQDEITLVTPQWHHRDCLEFMRKRLLLNYFHYLKL